jgi:DNA-binding response OmpR family regulator
MDRHTILVFGDERHLFQSICWALEYKGYCVRMTPRPEAALAHLIEQDFDLIVAKLRMEDLQSLDVLKRARKLNPEVGIMVVSPDCNVIIPLESLQIEIDDYLLLPITPNKLISRVGQCLEKLAAVKAAKAPMGRGVRKKQELFSRIMITPVR